MAENSPSFDTAVAADASKCIMAGCTTGQMSEHNRFIVGIVTLEIVSKRMEADFLAKNCWGNRLYALLPEVYKTGSVLYDKQSVNFPGH